MRGEYLPSPNIRKAVQLPVQLPVQSPEQSPGCGVANHDEACLCDVRIASPCSVTPDTDHPYATMARIALNGRCDQSSLDFWTEMLRIWEESKGLGVGPYMPFEQLSDLAAEWTFCAGVIDSTMGMLRQSTGSAKLREEHERVCRRMRTRQHRVLVTLRQVGFTPEACARFVACELSYVTRLLSRDERKLAAVAKLREGKSMTAAAREAGVPESTLRMFADRTGIVPMRKVSSGGGNKYTASQYEAVLALFEAGTPRAQIAKQVGMGYHAVNGILRRRSKAYTGQSRQVTGSRIGAL